MEKFYWLVNSLCMILTTECAVVDIKEESPAPMPPMGGGGMPGMM